MKEKDEKQSKILELKAYLNSTDYKVTRAFETKTEVDANTLKNRADAREEINRLEEEIKLIKDEDISDEILPDIHN